MTVPVDRLADLLPGPRRAVARDGVWRLPDVLRLAVAGADVGDAALLLRRARTILPLPVVAVPAASADRRGSERAGRADPGGGTDLLVRLGRDLLRGNGFRLEIDERGAVVTAADGAAAVAALHTLDRLLPVDSWRRAIPATGSLDAPSCLVEDEAAFAWRGVLLDVARHFLPKPELLKHLRVLASYQINRVQLHLTDDQGWRVESRAFPRLHEVGSWRTASQRGRPAGGEQLDGTPHGGYYTLADLAEITRYADDLGIEVIPEIDLPGHTASLVAAYPELGTPASRERAEVARTWGIHPVLVSPTPAVLDTVGVLLDEVLAAMPGGLVHLGGDEALIDGWVEGSVEGRAGAAGVREVFAGFLASLETLAEQRGRRLVLWDDAFAVQEHVARVTGRRTPSRAVVMAWRGEQVARRAAAAGRDVVLAPIVPTYLDYAGDGSPDEPLAIGGPVTLDDVVAWRPVPAHWTPGERSRVLGVQAQLWTEYVPDGRALDYLLYPRVLALADVAWSGGHDERQRPAARDRVAAQLGRLDAVGVEYRPLQGPRPWQRGGTGWRAHQPLVPMADVMQVHERAALDARTPTAAEYRELDDLG